ncbi:9208_t:CDS:2 [Ambispora leptoticha]|uniref:Nicotinamide-nucleotide adenylyltransferase n=1 Tax=Ambispora leptoticha TaxID=144679 RepID=A0A9N9B4U9_9GLOM|nr:9208_t:CDS:2 [Ambispora leptoticha]
MNDNHYNHKGSRNGNGINNQLHVSNNNTSPSATELEEDPPLVKNQPRNLEDYFFPTHRFQKTLQDPKKEPLVIVACGSFSPITYLHLRIFEMAKDYIIEDSKFEIMGGYFSPVSDHYKKEGLAPAYHRVRMCEMAVERTSTWLMIDAWESLQKEYTPTAVVLDHFHEMINIQGGGVKTSDGKTRNVKIMLLAGGDLIESFRIPNLWSNEDLHHILGDFGCLIVERTGADVWGFLLSHDILYEHRKNVYVIKQLIYNDISSTKVRLFVKRGMSIKYLLPNSVIKYIQQHQLYLGNTETIESVIDSDNEVVAQISKKIEVLNL